jgi:hypothetical protein
LLAPHWPPAQHGWPAPPHCSHTLRTHAPWVHVPLPQHAAPTEPQLPGPVVVCPLPPQATATEMTAKRNHVQAAMRIGRYLPSMRTNPHRLSSRKRSPVSSAILHRPYQRVRSLARGDFLQIVHGSPLSIAAHTPQPVVISLTIGALPTADFDWLLRGRR